MLRVAIILGSLLALIGCGDAAPRPTRPGPLLLGEPGPRFVDADAPARDARFSRDGRFLATTSAEGTIIVRNVPTWRVARKFRHEGGATSVEFSPDGAWMVTGGYDGTARMWDLASGKLLKTLRGTTGTIWSLDISPDGNRIATAGEDKIIRLWDVASGSVVAKLSGHELNIWEVRFSPDGARLASGSFDASVRIWDAASGRPLQTARDHDQAVVGLAYSPDGKWLATASDDSTVRVRRSSDASTVRKLANGDHAYSVAFSRDGQWLASSGRARGAFGTFWHEFTGSGGQARPVHLWRVADGAPVQSLPHSDDVMSATFSPDGRWLVTSCEDTSVQVWRLSERHAP